jgi:hypothetical protein
MTTSLSGNAPSKRIHLFWAKSFEKSFEPSEQLSFPKQRRRATPKYSNLINVVQTFYSTEQTIRYCGVVETVLRQLDSKLGQVALTPNLRQAISLEI